MQHCEICNKSVKKGNMRFHLKSKAHLENENKNNNVQEVNEFKENDSIEEMDNDNNDYLSDFNNTYNFAPIENIVKNDKKSVNNVILNDIITTKKKFKRDEDEFSSKSDDIFSNKNKTPLLGKNKRELIARVKQYKLLFKEELRSFRIKKNPSEEELEKYLEEIDSILSTSKLDSFVTDTVFYIMQVVENMSMRFKDYDLSGLTDALKNNKEFIDLMRLLSVKYHVFSNVPPEVQISIIVISTSYLVIMNNRNQKKMLEEQLKNQKI